MARPGGTPPSVIPAKAGIHGRLTGWIPAFAGMTTLAGTTLFAFAPNASAAPPEPPSPLPSIERQHALVRIVRQDCGSCHGMRLTGGLGPALTREALADRPLPSIVATVTHGRPGTPMPPWRTMLSDADVLWIAQQLQAGFPAETKGSP